MHSLIRGHAHVFYLLIAWILELPLFSILDFWNYAKIYESVEASMKFLIIFLLLLNYKMIFIWYSNILCDFKGISIQLLLSTILGSFWSLGIPALVPLTTMSKTWLNNSMWHLQRNTYCCIKQRKQFLRTDVYLTQHECQIIDFTCTV